MSVLARERETYETAWAVDAYATHSPGALYLPAFLEMSGATAPASVLDAGTGSGKGALALTAAGFSVMAADVTPDGLVPEARAIPFASACLWHDLTPVVYLARTLGARFRDGFDYVYCCDVLEHVPPTFTMLVIEQLLRVATRGAFFSIALTPDVFGAWVGKPLHQTVQGFTEWRDQIGEIGTVRECRDLLTTGLYWVTR